MRNEKERDETGKKITVHRRLIVQAGPDLAKSKKKGGKVDKTKKKQRHLPLGRVYGGGSLLITLK